MSDNSEKYSSTHDPVEAGLQKISGDLTTPPDHTPHVSRETSKNCFIQHICYSGISGATTVCLNLVTETSEFWNHEVLLYGIEPPVPGYLDRLNAVGIPYKIIQKKKGIDRKSLHDLAQKVMSPEKSNGPHIVIVHGVQMVPAFAFLKRKTREKEAVHFVGYLHGPMSEFSGLNLIKTWFFLRMSHSTIAVSQEIIDAAKNLPFTGIDKQPPILIENAVDRSFWKPQPTKKHTRSETVRLCYCGSLTPRKRAHLALEAVHHLRNTGIKTELDILGNGPEREKLVALATKLGLDSYVHFYGKIDHVKALKHYQQADFLIHPSKSEGLCMAMLEAMSSGLPVLLPDDINVPAAFTSATLIMHPGKWEPEVDRCLTTDGWQELSINARKTVVDHFTTSIQGKQFNAVMEKIQAAMIL